jgi:hypothetical protein
MKTVRLVSEAPEPEPEARAKKTNETQIVLKLPRDIYAQVKEIAERECRTVPGQITYWLKHKIDDYVGLEGKKK